MVWSECSRGMFFQTLPFSCSRKHLAPTVSIAHSGRGSLKAQASDNPWAPCKCHITYDPSQHKDASVTAQDNLGWMLQVSITQLREYILKISEKWGTWNRAHRDRENTHQLPATTILRLSLNLITLGISFERNHIILSFYVWHFAQWNVFKFHPFCSMCQNFIPFYGWIKYSTVWV